MADWHVGQKVVYVGGADPRYGWGNETLPVEGQTYTIRDIVLFKTGVSFRLQEIVNPKQQYIEFIGECCFRSKLFSPVADFKNDISVFHKILDRVNKTVVVMA